MSWVRELAEANGAGQATPPRASAAPDKVIPPLELVAAATVAPPVVHWGRIASFNNPGISFQNAETACGKPVRLGTSDGMAFEIEAVTCPDCLAVAAHEQASSQARPPAAVADPVAVKPPGATAVPAKLPVALADLSVSDFLDSLLDVNALSEKLRYLEGEVEAVRILLSAAEARQAKMAKQAGAAD